MTRLRPLTITATLAGLALLSFSSYLIASAEEYITGIQWETPPIVDPGETDDAPPSDAVVLFGKSSDTANWKNGERWTTDGDILIAGKGPITSKQEFGDCQIHVEWSAPVPAVGEGQGRGNSGIFMMGIYELQVLDSYENTTYVDGQAGAIYKQHPPMVNAMRKPGQWNTYDIIWTAPKFDDQGELTSPAYITAIHNGVVIQNHFELKGDTPFNRPPQYKAHKPTGPISIQDHNNPVRFRNIWVRPIRELTGEQSQPATTLTRPEQKKPAKSEKKSPKKSESDSPNP
ncbi:3-keto-disaccharide hydrolase [Neorhodopirellula pilleata]|uniref:3-keto-alpha-glucoside-1,2-lyase/3-keto-2-hydroxy-glucal hydratase domain-containing protein n=1 Tax=Neorhodopirellula pilleata TaxID=2714738 RepID=A0A5C6AW09_9BACT|nr:DUF1080 domain-containing protein [Neorhodopirellula pilleata]TWU03677.1 hypothetical protein Pla100_06070 [Neorhodopirellula pilleata]